MASGTIPTHKKSHAGAFSSASAVRRKPPLYSAMNAYLTKCLGDACRGCTVCQESGSHGSEVSGAASECAREDTEDVEEVEDSEGGCSGEEASNSGDAREGDSREGEKKKRKAHRGTRSSRARKKRRADSVVRKAGGIPREAVQRFIAQSAEAAAKATLDRAVETMIRREVKVRADHRQRVRILELVLVAVHRPQASECEEDWKPGVPHFSTLRRVCIELRWSVNECPNPRSNNEAQLSSAQI